MPLLLTAELVQALAHCAVAIAAAAAEGAKRAVVQRILGDLRFIQDPLPFLLELEILLFDLLDRQARIPRLKQTETMPAAVVRSSRSISRSLGRSV